LKICLVLEGSYPYVRGGVSSWVDAFIRNRPDHDFVLWTIGDFEDKRGQYVYDIADNVVLIQENFLASALQLRVKKSKNIRFTDPEREAIRQLIYCQQPNWRLLEEVFQERAMNPVEFLMSEDFLTILKDFAIQEYPFVGFLDLFWTVRSMFLPLLYLMTRPIAEADLYHSLSTGYGGALGSLASIKYNKPFVLSEHGIYTREREEEILLSEWVSPHLKQLWISMFQMYSRFCYHTAHRVTSLFGRASKIQQEMGCPPDKCDVVGNGILVHGYSSIPPKPASGWIDIGAIVRIAPIKDIKTLLYTFSSLKREIKNVRLHIIGPVVDEEYYQECLSLIAFYDVQDVIFAGIVDTRTYLEGIDFTVLTSISEGQPFALIESMAARRPVIATNVGNCRELTEGAAGDHFGTAGICVPPMDQAELLYALRELCRNAELRKNMGEVGYQRASTFFDLDEMLSKYSATYEKATLQWQALASN